MDLPLRTFLAAPTARELAAVVRSGATHRAFDPVVPLRESGDRTPLFLAHPIGGNVLCYRELVGHLAGDRPVYGLQAAGAEPGTEPLASMEALAASYVEAIRRVHPEGPFHIAGWSFGGYVAVEIARRLDEAQVASVTLLDTVALGDGPWPLADDRELIVAFFRELLWYATGRTELADGFDPSDEDPGRLFDAVFRRSVELGILPEDAAPQLLRRLYGVFRANYRATVGHRMPRVRHPLVVLRAGEELPAGLAAAHRAFGGVFDGSGDGWQRRAGRAVETVPVPGNHLTMMAAPHVAAVAAELDAALARAESRSGDEREVA